MLTMYHHANVQSVADVLGHVQTAASAQGWTIDHSSLSGDSHLHIHNAGGQHFTFKSLFAPDDITKRHLVILGSTGYDSGRSWYDQPGLYCNQPEDYYYGQHPVGTGYWSQNSYNSKIVASHWLFPPADIWIFADSTNLICFTHCSGYAASAVNADTICLAFYIGRISDFEETNSFPLVFSDVVSGKYNYSGTMYIASSTLLGKMAWDNRNYNATGSYTSNSKRVVFPNGGGALLKDGCDILPISKNSVGLIKSHSDSFFFIKNNAAGAVQYADALTYLHGADRSILIKPLIMVPNGDNAVYPIGELPYWAVRFTGPIRPGSTLSIGNREYVCFPLLTVDNDTGVALQVA